MLLGVIPDTHDAEYGWIEPGAPLGIGRVVAPEPELLRLTLGPSASRSSIQPAARDRRGQPLSPEDSAAPCVAEGIPYRCRLGS
jgi:hypothetical protein